jgi:ubiquinone/menaquinone biosynthesis C-methylase UbiE
MIYKGDNKMSIWPKDFARIPTESWATKPLEELAMKYDTVEEHGWYDNLDFTVSQLSNKLTKDSILLDYSGGTGILTSRLLRMMQAETTHMLIVDSSPKFLRLSLEKFLMEPKVAFRLINYIKAEKRLEGLDEILPQSILDRGVDAVVSTNAVHLYYGLEKTIHSWKQVLKPNGFIHIQSGNIRNPAAGDSWIIDETVEHIHKVAVDLVKSHTGFQSLSRFLIDTNYMKAHDKLRQKYFLPVRPLDYYVDALQNCGLRISSCDWKPIQAAVDEWYDFLAVYHEGVLGWVGGAEKITGVPASPHFVSLRKALMRIAMEEIFNGKGHFQAAWTYIEAKIK